MIKKIAYFLRLLDEDDRLNLEDIAFCVILSKIAFSSTVDWTALVTLAVCCLNTIHKRHTDAVLDTTSLQQSIQDQADSLTALKDKISPILEAVKGKIA